MLIAEAVLSTICQCMTRQSCLNYLLILSSEDALASMAKSNIFVISNNAKMILSSLSHCLPSSYHSSFKLTEEECTDMLYSLDVCLERGISDGELYFSALEMFQSFNLLIQFESNRKVMAHSTVYKSIAHLLQSDNDIEQFEACKLLWKLVTMPMSEQKVVIPVKKSKVEIMEELNPHEYMSEPGIHSFLHQNYPEILATLSAQTLQCQNATIISGTRLVLMNESEEIIGKGTH